MFRKRIFEVIEVSKDGDKLSSAYDYSMLTIIVCSLVPLAFKQNHIAFTIIDYFCSSVFIIDYLLRWLTADFKYENKNAISFLRYPFGFMALIDLITILPTFTPLSQGFKLLRVFRLLKAFRVFRAFRYSKSVKIIARVLKRTRRSLLAVGTFALAYILISSLVIFNVEPDSFDTFFDAIYWATVSLTTVGYGDIYPITVAGRIVTMFSSLFGIAIIALPSGIITAGYMEEIKKTDKDENLNNNDNTDND